MSDYKYGDWYCVPSTTDEAEEIIRLAVKSGASNEWCYGGDDDCAPYGVVGGVVGYDTIKGVKYTIEQLRKMFLDTANQWNGEGLPPVGAVLKPEQVRLWGSNGWEALSDSVTAVSVDFIGASNVIITLSYHNKSREIHSLGGHIEFIPLRTKREKWIDKVIMYFYEDSEKTRTILGEIYDAGLAKDIEE